MTAESIAPADTSALAARDLPRFAERQAHAAEPPIPSSMLLLGRTSVTIDHQGVQYVLRTTRAGKLILTK
jgi:hemin uptake protein HemP